MLTVQATALPAAATVAAELAAAAVSVFIAIARLSNAHTGSAGSAVLCRTIARVACVTSRAVLADHIWSCTHLTHAEGREGRHRREVRAVDAEFWRAALAVVTDLAGGTVGIEGPSAYRDVCTLPAAS